MQLIIVAKLSGLNFFFSYFRHALIVFGGVHGLETSLEADENLAVDDPSLLFQHYINTCPQQGSRTIRTEVIPSETFDYFM
jgi:hypothetical protein